MTMTGTAVIPTFTLADRLRKAREITGMDQVEFAARAEMSRNSVANYEHGRRAPRRIYLKAWAEASGVDLAWLETGRASSQREDEADVRPKGFEPPTFCSGASALLVILLAAARQAVRS